MLYLVIAVVLLGSVAVRIERGRLTLSGIAIGAAAILLNPLDATIVGLALAIPMARRGHWTILGNGIMAAAYACLGALVAAPLHGGQPLMLGSRILVLLVVNVGSWLLIGVGLSLRSGESIASIARHNFTGQFYAAFAYFALPRLRNLGLHPLAGHARRGEDQQQFVVEPDGVIDLFVYFPTGLNIMRRKPATDAFVLKVGVKTVGEILILRRVADKAAVVLNRMVY